jgi:hypothetical protein
MGTRMTMLESLWDYRQVQDFEYLADLWNDFVEVDDAAVDHCQRLGEELRQQLSMPIVDMDPDESRFFKHHYKSNFKNQGIMSRE